jgi:sarcosine oxidase subunit gamma
MPDPVASHPLAGHLAAGSAARRDASVRVNLPAPSGLWQVLAFPGKAETVAQALAKLASTRPEIAVRQTAPDDWLALSYAIGHADLAEALSAALGEAAALVDQSDAKAVLIIDGKDSRALLSKGTAVDLHPDAFPEGKSVATLFNHFAIQLTRTGGDAFEIIAARSFAESLFEELMECGREFGMTAGR